MTDEELRVRAIQELEFYKKDDTFMLADITVDLAIEALKQMPVTTTAGEGGVIYYPQVEGVTPTVIDAGKQEPCEDAISREDALMCLTGEIKDTDTIETIIARSARRIRKLPSVNPRPCEDAISRQAVIDSLHSKFADGFDSDRWWNSMSVLYAINKVPPVNPTKTGHWIEHPKIETSTPEYLMFYECSECGDRQCFCKSDIHKKRFCSNCGYRMVEPQESEGEA